MAFKNHFFNRLKELSNRDAQVFPKVAIPVPYKPAAVLLPFWPTENGGVEVVFTKRTDTVSTHRGQVSFPGGSVDDSDESMQAAALREAYEELGISPQQVSIMGRLDDAWSRAGHHVIPFVGWLDQKPELIPNPIEVAEVIIADVEMLMRPEISATNEIVVDNVVHTTHAFRWDDGYVWGLSADLLLELLLWIRGEPSDRFAARLKRMQKFSQTAK